MSDKLRNYRSSLNYALINRIFYINAPEFRGAPYPKRDPYRINEEDLPDNMRCKSCVVSKEYVSDDFIKYYVRYITQEPFSTEDAELFMQEVMRAVDVNEKDLKETFFIDKDILIELEIISRDGQSNGYYSVQIKIDADVDEDTFLEDINDKDTIRVYFGFKGGEAGDYFDADYLDIIYFNDKWYWEEAGGSYSSGSENFDSFEDALDNAIKTMQPDDGSEIIVDKDPDRLYDRLFGEE